MDYNAKIVMLKGADGADIKDIAKTATKTLVDTYTITLSDGRKYIFNVTNGKAIKNVAKTSTSGLTDTYTINFNDGSTQTFNVTNGVGFKNIAKTATSGLTDTYTLTLTDGTTKTFPVTNGRSVKDISKTGSEGLVDTYTVTYNDSTTQTFTVTNGKAGNIDNMGAVLDKVYPVGAIYMSVVNTSPATLFGGTWEQIQGKFLLGADSTYTAGSTGGEATHTLTSDEMPTHNHALADDIDSKVAHSWGWGLYNDSDVYAPVAVTQGAAGEDTNYLCSRQGVWTKTANAGGGQAHNNMPPYLSVYMWKRTA